MKALELALNKDRFALGILYMNPNRRPYNENVRIYNEDKRPLYQRDLDKEKFNQLLKTFR